MDRIGCRRELLVLEGMSFDLNRQTFSPRWIVVRRRPEARSANRKPTLDKRHALRSKHNLAH
jgi:hypothetical protein